MKPPSYYSLLMNSLMEHEVVSKYINENVIQIIELEKDYGPATKFVGLLYMHNNHRYCVYLHTYLHTYLRTYLLFTAIETQTITTGSYAMMMFTTRSQLGVATT